jgi:hypothetical protein
MIRKKKESDLRLGLAILAGVSLFALYLYSMSFFAGAVASGPMDQVESAIFYTMILRVLGLFFVPRLRRLPSQVKIVLLSLEAFVLVLVIIAAISTGSSGDTQIMADILTAWLVTALIVVTPYTIYELAVMMYKGTSVTALVFSAAPLVAICLFLSNLPSRIPNPPSGIGDFGVAVIDSMKTQAGFAGPASGGQNAFISGASVLFLLAIIVYIAFQLNLSSIDFAGTFKFHYALSLMVIGSLAMFLWLFATTDLLKGNIFEILSLPAAGIPILLWVVCRER